MAKLTFKSAFMYPFNRPKGLLNALWIFLPIIGWFALGGYGIRIVKEFLKGKFRQLPVFNFNKDLKLGFFMFLKAIPFILVYMLVINLIESFVDVIGITQMLTTVIDYFISLFIVPLLTINFFKKETISSYFEFKILKSIINNLNDYIVVLLKSIALAIIFFVMIVVLVGLPAGMFTQNIFFADFYRQFVK